MQYLEKIDERNLDSKKVVGARVSEHVIAALNSAGDDINMFGYNFSISKVIEKALNNTLLEIKEKNGNEWGIWILFSLQKWAESFDVSK